VTDRCDGLVGACGVSRIGDPSEATWELGYWFGVPYWGLGYASEAAQAVMAWARDQLGALVFGAGHFVDNPASGAVLRKLGFVPTGPAELFGLARQCVSPCDRYVWPEGAAPVSLANHAPH
jgi:RimJ/RimL family protein N-acetyltransferase